jgi:hypothetical protein
LFCNSVAFMYFRYMFRKINWDAWGIGASLACAIHCALLPLFFSSLPLFGINIIHNVWFEVGMIGFAVGIGTFSLWHGFKKHHHRLQPLILFYLGSAFLISKQFFIRYENWLLVPAVILIIVAHVQNYRACRVHDHGHEEDCEH